VGGPVSNLRHAPPPLADALLERWLPSGVLGLSILGDLHQEYEEMTATNALRLPRFWYWRSALSLSGRYALLAFKNRVLTPASGESTVVEMTMTMMTDLRFAFRMLLKTPLLSLIAIVTIGLGVGLTTHTFSSVYGSVLRGLPVPGEDRLMYVDANRLELGIPAMDIVLHDFLDLREQQTSFEDLVSFRQVTANLAGEDGAPERFAGAYVSANARPHLGVQPELGRIFLPGEDAFDAAPRMVLGYHVWMNRFGGDRGVLGRTIPVNGQLTEIVGVMPEGFRFPFREDVWIVHRQDTSVPRGEGQDLDVFGKLREGTSIETARAELTAIASRLAEAYPESNEGIGLGVQPFEERYMPAEIRSVMWVMLAATFGVLLIACANVANLLLARTSIRSKEVAVRIAMGAGRFRVIRQLMVESLLLAFFGGLVGYGLSAFGVYVFNAAIMDIERPYWIDVRMDLPVLAFSIAVTAFATVAAGMFPAVRASGVKIGDVLKNETRGSSSLRLGRFSSALVITEIAVSCGLLIGAGFMIKSVINVGNVELGFETENVMTGRVTLFDTDYPDAESRDQFFQALKQRLASEPGVESAALASSLPGMGSGRYYLPSGRG
jgi:predicted permease